MSDVLEFFKKFSEVDDALDVRMASDSLGQKLSVISTGSLVLDDALSCGGLPKGRVIQYYGPGGSGKSLMAMIAIKNAQAEDPTAEQVIIDSEQTFDPAWAHTLGLDVSKIVIIDGDTAARGQTCFEFLLGVPKEDSKTHTYIGKSKEGLFDKIINKELNVNLVVLDSLGQVQPPGEDISRVGKMNIGLMARFLTTTLKKVSLEVSKANIPFIIINHKHESLDMYGPDHTYSGGNTLTHTLSANIYFEAVQRKDAQILNDKEQKIGHMIRAKVEKSKFGPWPRTCEFKVNFGVGVVDQHEEIASLAVNYNIINKLSSMSYEYGDKKWVGINKVCEGIQADPVLAGELRDKINAARELKWENTRAECAARVSESGGKKRAKK